MRESLTNRYFQGIPGLSPPQNPGTEPKLGSKNRTCVLPIFQLNGQNSLRQMLDGIRFMIPIQIVRSGKACGDFTSGSHLLAVSLRIEHWSGLYAK